MSAGSPEPVPLRSLALRGSAFEIGGYAVGTVLRLGSNLIVTRLLAPSAFGLMAIVMVVSTGLIMFSDVGIEPAVVQNERGGEAPFLNTAWTLQVIRGFILAAVMAALAWPISVLYREPLLVPLLSVGSLTLLVNGFHSTSLYTLRRNLEVGKLTLLELTAQVAAVTVMVPWAWMRPSVWALLGGMFAYAIARTAGSYLLRTPHRHALRVEPRSRAAIKDFGKWILGSSTLGFSARQLDRVIVGRLLGLAELGTFSIASNLAEAMNSAILRVSIGVLLPALSRVRESGADRLRGAYRSARLALDLVSLPALGALTILGPLVVHVLYDRRYAAAGWVLQALAVRVAMSCVLAPGESTLNALGLTRYGMYGNVARLAWVAVGMPVGWSVMGLHGVVFAAASTEIPVFFIQWPALHRVGLLDKVTEVRALALYLAGLLGGWMLNALVNVHT